MRKRTYQSEVFRFYRYSTYLTLIVLYLIYLYYTRQAPQPASEKENPIKQGNPVEDVRQLSS